MNVKKDKKHNRSQELGYITRKLKLLAQLLQIPIITISQLNRNIENRSNKEPLLSDLKESGCINYKNNIDIRCKYRQNVSIKNISNKSIKLKVLKNFKKLNSKVCKNINENDVTLINASIKLNHKYIFKYIQRIQYCKITHNHKCLSVNAWIESNKILSCTTINLYSNRNQNLLQKQYVNYIKFNNYLKSYDVNQNYYFTITANNVITHNSIEQDADIILTLYEKEYEEINQAKIIDIKVSKNRNGNTGYCKLIFLPEVSKFQSIEKF